MSDSNLLRAMWRAVNKIRGQTSGGFRYGQTRQPPGAGYLWGAPNHMGGATSSKKKSRCIAVIIQVLHNIVWGIGILAPPLAAGAHLLVEKVPCADGMKPPLKPVNSSHCRRKWAFLCGGGFRRLDGKG